MNVFLWLAIVSALFIPVDFLTAKLLKRKRTMIRNVTLIMLCILTVVCGFWGVKNIFRDRDTTNRTLYIAYNYLLEGNSDAARQHAEQVRSPHADIISALADCMEDNYASAFINMDDLMAGEGLNQELSEQAERIYALSREMTGLEGFPRTDEEAREELDDIVGACFALLEISEKKEVEFLSGFQYDSMLTGDNFYAVDAQTLSEMLLETPKDSELLRYSVKYYNAYGNLEEAEENARKLLNADKSVENIVLYTDVIAQKLLNDMSIVEEDEEDKEIASLLKQAEKAEEMAGNYEEGNPRREENLAKAEDYRRQANGVKAKRIINWLLAQAPLFGDKSGVIELQLSKLYIASGDDEKARELLVELMRDSDELHEDSPVKTGLERLKRVYYDNTASEEDISTAIRSLLNGGAFLPESVLSRGYSEFLNNFLRYERVSVFISRVDAEDYPTVRAYLNVNGKHDGVEELANDFRTEDFTFSDNGFTINARDVKRIEDDSNNFISIALVIDGSGSMEGERIENARRAVEACIENLTPETQELSVVLYENAAAVLSPLTSDVSELRAAAAGINASGGTNIPAGLREGIASLEDAAGTKAIILMTDGEDGNPGEMPAAIEAARAENIAVFTVSTGGGNREYMENIARQTGGFYMEAFTDAELVNVYTALQNFIVNNYCFEYTVSEDRESNPRVLTIGLADYEVSSSRTYAYGGVVLARDGSFIVRGDSGSLRLLYAEPSVVSAKDAQLGVPVFLNVDGATEGAQVYINGDEVKNVSTVGDSVIAFLLEGEYPQGALQVNVRLKDGTSRSSDSLLAIDGGSDSGLTGQTILLGNGNTLYADVVEQKDDYTLSLSGNVILNGLVRTDSRVTLQANAPVSLSGGRISISAGSVMGSGPAYVDFAAPKDQPANYGQMAFGGSSARVMDVFGFYFDGNSLNFSYSGATLRLPGFGEVYGDMKLDGSEITCTVNGGYELGDLQNNLNYALNGVAVGQNKVSGAMQTITGYQPQYQSSSYNGSGLYARSEMLTIVIRKDFMEITGSGFVNGYLGALEVNEARVAIDTSRVDSMFEIKGNLIFQNLSRTLNIEGQFPFTIQAAGYYPDTLSFDAGRLSVQGGNMHQYFTEGVTPEGLEGSIDVQYPLELENELYQGQIGGFLTDVSLSCDRVTFVNSGEWNKNGIKVYNSENPDFYVMFTTEGIEIPVMDMDELSLFGSRLGGEISGTALIAERQIALNLNVDGHLDNGYYGIEHDGRAGFSAVLQRGASAGSHVTVTLSYDGKTVNYEATAGGNISIQNGFSTYAEDYGE